MVGSFYVCPFLHCARLSSYNLKPLFLLTPIYRKGMAIFNFQYSIVYSAHTKCLLQEFDKQQSGEKYAAVITFW